MQTKEDEKRRGWNNLKIIDGINRRRHKNGENLGTGATVDSGTSYTNDDLSKNYEILFVNSLTQERLGFG